MRGAFPGWLGLAEDDVKVQLLRARLSKGPHMREAERRESPQGWWNSTEARAVLR